MKGSFRRETPKGPEANVLIASRVWGSARGSIRTPVSGSLDFSLIPLSVLQRIVESEVKIG